MKLRYLGTAASEGIPAVFCECETCRRARELGGKNIRTRSQAIIDDRLLIDFPADSYAHSLQYGISLAKIRHCLITHSHPDHLYPEELCMRQTGVFAHIEKEEPLTFYADESGYEMIAATIEANRIPEKDVAVQKIELYTPFDVDGYRVIALRATHSPESTPVVYIIQKDGKGIFYLHDTSLLRDEPMQYLKEFATPLDLLSMDCTGGSLYIPNDCHLDIHRCKELVESFKEIGVADDRTRVVVNHFSHNGGHVLHDEIAPIAREFGFTAAYDGLEIIV